MDLLKHCLGARKGNEAFSKVSVGHSLETQPASLGLEADPFAILPPLESAIQTHPITRAKSLEEKFPFAILKTTLWSDARIYFVNSHAARFLGGSSSRMERFIRKGTNCG